MNELSPIITASLHVLTGKKGRHLVLGRSREQYMVGEISPTGEPRLA